MAGNASEHAHRLLTTFVEASEIAGGAVVALHRGEIIVEAFAGEAAPGLLAGPTVLWPLASISKAYTAAAIMRLVERGLLTLHTPTCALLPSFTGAGREQVRLRHLLTHTAGMLYEPPNMEELLRRRTPLARLVAQALAAELLFPPGTALGYADNHYLVAGRMAELVTGEPFQRLVRREVLLPAGLSQTYFPPAARDEERLALVRGVLAEGSTGAMYNSRYARQLAHPAFGVVASVHDLARFALHFMPGGPRIHAEATVRAMISDQTGGVAGHHPAMAGSGTSTPVPWGLGWYLQGASVPGILADLGSPSTFGHAGASGCLVVGDPALDLVVAVVSNTHLRVDLDRWQMRLAALANCAFAALG